MFPTFLDALIAFALVFVLYFIILPELAPNGVLRFVSYLLGLVSFLALFLTFRVRRV